MLKYNKQLLEENKFKNSSTKVIQVSLNNKKQMDVSDVEELVNGLETMGRKKKENIKIMVRALLVDKWITLKGYNDELQLDEFDEYYKNKVSNSSKFEKFAQLQIYVAKQNNI